MSRPLVDRFPHSKIRVLSVIRFFSVSATTHLSFPLHSPSLLSRACACQVIKDPNEGWKPDHQKAAEKSAAWAASGNVDTPDYFEEDGKKARAPLRLSPISVADQILIICIEPSPSERDSFSPHARDANGVMPKASRAWWLKECFQRRSAFRAASRKPACRPICQ